MAAPDQPDIDPGWYPGQLETASSDHVPTVLTKLQKWGDYCGVGEPVRPTRFIPMKTPLSKQILSQWSLPQQPKYSLTVPEMLETQREQGRQVGLILDLSNHECLYTPDIPEGLQYLHINLVAKELPPLDYVRRVAAAADQFWRENPDMYIAIHCAYGFNRTGFVVCSYLIEHCGLSVQQALDAFATSRPPGVKHEKFRDELRRRYHDWPTARSQSGNLSRGDSGTLAYRPAAAAPSCSPQLRLAPVAPAEDDNSSIGNTPDLEDVSSVSPLPASRVASALTGRLSPAAGLPPMAASPSLVVTEAKLSNLRFARAESSGGATSSSVPDNESLGYSEREILAALTCSSKALELPGQEQAAELGQLIKGRVRQREAPMLSNIEWGAEDQQEQQQGNQQQQAGQQGQQQAAQAQVPAADGCQSECQQQLCGPQGAALEVNCRTQK